MKLTNTKNALLIILVFGVILQTAQLWLEVYSSHNFFYTISAKRTRHSEETHKINPSAIFANIDGATYVPVLNDNSKGLIAAGDALITQMLASGKYIDSEPLNWSNVLDFKSVIYEYAGLISTESFARSYSERGAELRSKVNSFDTIIISPQRTMSEIMKVLVIDRYKQNVYTFELSNASPDSLLREIDKIESAATDVTYVSSVQNGLNFFSSGNVFLPLWKQPYLSYSPAFVSNPIDEANNLEKSVELFFDNPVGLVGATDSNGTPFFSSGNAVVKYYKNDGLLTYTNYTQSSNDRIPASFAESYTTALNFLKRDVTLLNDLVLTKSVFADGAWTFYFGYKLNGISVFVASEEGPLKHAVEITVDGRIVSRYLRVVMELATAEKTGRFDRTFIEVLDSILANAELTEEENELENMAIGYVITEYGANYLKWLVESDEKWLAVEE